DGVGEQEGQHVGGFTEQLGSLLDQRRGLGEDVFFAVSQFLPDQVAILQIRDQAVAEVFGLKFANVGAVDCDRFFLIKACGVGQHVVDVEVFDEFFRGEDVFISRQ